MLGYLEERLENFLLNHNSKYFSFCGSAGLCCNSSTLLYNNMKAKEYIMDECTCGPIKLYLWILILEFYKILMGHEKLFFLPFLNIKPILSSWAIQK